MMSEDELQKKRQEFRDQEVMNKITSYSSVTEYRQQVLKSNYTRRVVNREIGRTGKILIITQATFLALFSLLFVFSYIPHTKFIITKIMP